jgi:hypothetical protein
MFLVLSYAVTSAFCDSYAAPSSEDVGTVGDMTDPNKIPNSLKGKTMFDRTSNGLRCEQFYE